MKQNEISIFIIKNYNKKISSTYYTNKILNFIYGEKYFVYKDNNGKPYVNLDYYVSISHTKNILVIAISNFEIGIDIEEDRYIDKYLYNLFKSSKDYNQISYIQNWTIKESFLKLLGVGLLIEPSKIIIKKNYIIYNDLIAKFKTYKLDGYIISFSSFETEIKTNIFNNY